MTKIMNYNESAEKLADMMFDIEMDSIRNLMYYIRARVEDGMLILTQEEEVGTAFKPNDYIFEWQGEPASVADACDGDINALLEALDMTMPELTEMYQQSLIRLNGPDWTYFTDDPDWLDYMTNSDWFDFVEHNDALKEKFLKIYFRSYREEYYQNFLDHAYQILDDEGYEPAD